MNSCSWVARSASSGTTRTMWHGRSTKGSGPSSTGAMRAPWRSSSRTRIASWRWPIASSPRRRSRARSSRSSSPASPTRANSRAAARRRSRSRSPRRRRMPGARRPPAALCRSPRPSRRRDRRRPPIVIRSGPRGPASTLCRSPYVSDRLADLGAPPRARAAARLADFVELLRIPSVSALPEHAGHCREAAAWIAGRLTRAGLEHVEVAETGGHPVVYADWLHADGAPTVLVYAHYDVQPDDPLEEWVKPPFDPRIEDGRVFARGAADDKSHVHMLISAAAAWLTVRGRLPVNLRFVFEGEEESGSENLDRWLAAERERLSADLAVISDTGFFEGNRPSITTGLRGMMYAQLDVTGPRQDLHSGGYGGPVRNPATVLAEIIAGLHTREGRVDGPGFFDDVRPLGEGERAEFARLPFDQADYMAEMGVDAPFAEAG